MQIRRLYAPLAAGCLLAMLAPATRAQNEAPFTIRRPPDGATVREKVRVEIPLASIPEGGYVTYSIDGQFRVALAPTDEYRQKEEMAATKEHRAPVFVFTWDTKKPEKVRGSVKEEAPKEGDHEIAAALYSGSSSVAKQTSAVHVRVANKVEGDPGAVDLRYKFPDASNRLYERNGETAIVAGLTQGMQGTGDQELVGQRSKLLVAVEDVYRDGSAMVRNKLKELVVRQNGQETVYPENTLPQSLYQQLDSRGKVEYQNANYSFDQFAQLGIPVDTTLALPLLPTAPKRVGDTWQEDEKQPIDIPGTPPDKQPKVTITSTLEGIEWEGGYPTAKIHQTFDSTKGGLNLKSITVGSIQVDNPTIKFDRDIYLAFRSGTLVKIVRKMEITGKTTQQMGSAGGMSGGAPPGMSGGYGSGGPAGYGNMQGGGRGRSMTSGGGGDMGAGSYGAMLGGSMGGGYGGGAPGPGGRGRGGYGGGAPGPGGRGRGSMGGGSMGGPGMAGGLAGPGGMAGGGALGMPGAGAGPGMRGSGGGGFAGGGFSGGGTTGPTQITLKSTTTTELDRTGAAALK